MSKPADKANPLEALAAQAEEILVDQPEPGDTPATPPPVPAQTSAQLLGGMIQLARELFCFIADVKSPRVVLNDQAVMQLGDAWGAVADKRGWDLSKLMGDYATEVSAIMLTATIGVSVSKAVKAEMAAMERARPIEAANDAVASVDGAPADGG